MSKRGFTMIEVVIALGIMVAFLCMTTVSMRSLERQRLVSAYRQLRVHLRMCQRLAIAEKRKHEIFFDVAAKYIYIIQYAGDDDKIVGHKKFTLPEGVEIKKVSTSSNIPIISYTTAGTITTGSTVSLQTNNYTLEFTVNVASGRVNEPKLSKRQHSIDRNAWEW